MKKTTPLNIAHRGARSIAPENTILAASKALAIGADMWELDVAMTADGVIVVIHDDTLERTSDAVFIYPDRKPWKVENFTLEELQRLDFGSWYLKIDPFKQIAAGNISDKEQSEFVGLHIPTLQEGLEFTRAAGWRVNVEIKDLSNKPGDLYIAGKLCSQIEKSGMEDAAIISSFNHSYLQQVRSFNSKITTAALVEEPDPDPVNLLKQLGAHGYNPNVDTIDFKQITEVTAAGFEVFVWTVNEQETMRKLIDAGVSGIFTDFPQVLKLALA